MTPRWPAPVLGSGRALVEAARHLVQAGLADRATLVGVDLVDTFEPGPDPLPGLELICASVAGWQPAVRFDLITCVHGLHYIGDKLALITRAASWLTPGGRLIADLDLAAIHLDGRPAGRPIGRRLRQAGFTYNARRHQITCTGQRNVRLPYRYLGADDQAGPGYTGQPAVSSHYTETETRGSCLT